MLAHRFNVVFTLEIVYLIRILIVFQDIQEINHTQDFDETIAVRNIQMSERSLQYGYGSMKNVVIQGKLPTLTHLNMSGARMCRRLGLLWGDSDTYKYLVQVLNA